MKSLVTKTDIECLLRYLRKQLIASLIMEIALGILNHYGFLHQIFYTFLGTICWMGVFRAAANLISYHFPKCYQIWVFPITLEPLMKDYCKNELDKRKSE